MLVATIALALLFDFINGFHDSANAIATVVATRVLKPVEAVALAGAANFAGPFVFGVAIAKTIQDDILNVKSSPHLVLPIMAAGLLGAIVWDLMTWWWGLPTSSSHALVGGLIGAGLAAGGAGLVKLPARIELVHYANYAALGFLLGAFVALLFALVVREVSVGAAIGLGGLAGFSLATVWAVYTKAVNLGGIGKTVAFIVVSPFLGFVLAYALTVLLISLFRRFRPNTINRGFGRLQILSSAFYSVSHGSNDAQKTMGVITGALASSAIPAFGPSVGGVPIWVILSAASAIGLGTFFGGWRIVRTMATRITHLVPYQGFAAETAGGGVLVFMALHGIPVSTTHAISGSIMGVGATKKLSAVRWGVARQIVLAWLITIPAAAAVAAVAYWMLHLALGLVA